LPAFVYLFYFKIHLCWTTTDGNITAYDVKNGKHIGLQNFIVGYDNVIRTGDTVTSTLI
jgi:hypothetical protein